LEQEASPKRKKEDELNIDTMKEVTLKIPENRLTFFMELVEQLGFEVAGELEISEEHKAMVRDRIKKSDQNPERLLDWEQVQDNFQLD
jgi:hypothetical protein